MTFNPGELDQRIRIMRQVNASDGYGGNTVAWSEVSEVWAKVRPLSGRENTDYDRINAETGYLFVVRNPLDVIESDKVEWLGDDYNIRVIKKPTGRKLYMQIEGESGVAQ